MFVYLARPIDQRTESPWLDKLTSALERKLQFAGIGAFRPHAAFLCNAADPELARSVDEINQYALHGADALVAVLPAGMPTLGTPAEIEQAIRLNKPTVILTDILGSVQLAAWGRSGATVISTGVVPQSDDLRQMLLRVPDPDREDEDEVGSEPPAGLNTMLVRYDKGALPLTKAHPGDAGFDVAILEDVTLHYGERALLKTGVRASIPEGFYGRLTGRSSAATRWKVEVHEGIIDAGYTGELLIGVTYKGPGGHVDIPAGTRLGQYIVGPVCSPTLVIVDELPVSLRGEKGFGSSGV